MPTPIQRQAFGLKILNAGHPSIRKLKSQGFQAEIHGNKFWNSSFLVMDYLKRNPLPQGTRVLEVGCGWGLLGLYCAKAFDAAVTGIDADANVGPYLDLHAQLNHQSVTFEQKSFNQLTKAYLANFDVIIGADICFWDELSQQLFNLIRRAQGAGVLQTILADPCRSPFETLAARSAAAFKSVERIEAGISRPTKATGALLIVRADP